MSTVKILTVDEVRLAILKSNPPQLRILCKGTVPTLGWSGARLVPYIYKKPPADGLQDFDFVACPPAGAAGQALQDIEAAYVIRDIPDWLKGVRIHASTNNREATFGGADELPLSPKDAGTLEVLAEVSLTKTNLSARVYTGGCTDRDSFAVEVDKGVTGLPPYELSIHRMHPDLCDGHFPEGKVVTWTREDLGIEPGATLRLVNMIGDLKG